MLQSEISPFNDRIIEYQLYNTNYCLKLLIEALQRRILKIGYRWIHQISYDDTFNERFGEKVFVAPINIITHVSSQSHVRSYCGKKLHPLRELLGNHYQEDRSKFEQHKHQFQTHRVLQPFFWLFLIVFCMLFLLNFERSTYFDMINSSLIL